MQQQTWDYKTIEVKPSFLGSFDAATLNELLSREGKQGWELVSTQNFGPMRPIMLFFKRPR